MGAVRHAASGQNVVPHTVTATAVHKTSITSSVSRHPRATDPLSQQQQGSMLHTIVVAKPLGEGEISEVRGPDYLWQARNRCSLH